MTMFHVKHKTCPCPERQMFHVKQNLPVTTRVFHVKQRGGLHASLGDFDGNKGKIIGFLLVVLYRNTGFLKDAERALDGVV